MAALATDIDISVLYHGVDPKNVHRLVSVVCIFVLMMNHIYLSSLCNDYANLMSDKKKRNGVASRV